MIIDYGLIDLSLRAIKNTDVSKADLNHQMILIRL